MAKRESAFQADLIRELKKRFPECEVLKNDSSYRQGIPDLTVFYGPYWAMLECKRGAGEKRQPNQDWYVDRMNSMGFAAFIFPENKDEVLDRMERYFG